LVNTPNNGKDYEKTLVKRQLVALTVGWLTQRRLEAELRQLGRAPGDDLWEGARLGFEGGLLIASSQDTARAYAENLPNAPPSFRAALDERILLSSKERGVAVGSLPKHWRKRSFKKLLPAQRHGVKRILAQVGDEGLGSRLDEHSVVMVKSVQFGEHNFAKKDFVVFQGTGARVAEQYGRIELLYSASDSRGQRRVFADVTFFRVQFQDGRPSGAAWHNSLLLTNLKPLENDRVRLASDILRHFIPCPEPGESVHTSQSNHVIEVFPPAFRFAAADVWVPQLPRVTFTRLTCTFFVKQLKTHGAT
jgi:hypothetical protein